MAPIEASNQPSFASILDFSYLPSLIMPRVIHTSFPLPHASRCSSLVSLSQAGLSTPAAPTPCPGFPPKLTPDEDRIQRLLSPADPPYPTAEAAAPDSNTSTHRGRSPSIDSSPPSCPKPSPYPRSQSASEVDTLPSHASVLAQRPFSSGAVYSYSSGNQWQLRSNEVRGSPDSSCSRSHGRGGMTSGATQKEGIKKGARGVLDPWGLGNPRSAALMRSTPPTPAESCGDADVAAPCPRDPEEAARFQSITQPMKSALKKHSSVDRSFDSSRMRSETKVRFSEVVRVRRTRVVVVDT